MGSGRLKTRTRLLDDVLNVQYVEGRLIFLRGTTLMAQRFDVKRLALEGEQKC